MDQPSYSYGAAYADLNNDGRLDLVVNNMNAPAFIYENIAPKDDAHHYLEVKLVGESPREETAGIGAQLILTTRGQKQYAYYSPYRGFMSTMDDRAHFGLGRFRRADTLEVEWPDQRYQLLTNLDADRLLIVKQSDATREKRPHGLATAGTARDQWFQPLKVRGLGYKQPSTTHMDFSVQPLLPYNLSSHGPPVAVADINGDGLDDVFIGGAAGVAGKLFIQRKDGSFVESRQGEPGKPTRLTKIGAHCFLTLTETDGQISMWRAVVISSYPARRCCRIASTSTREAASSREMRGRCRSC